MALRVGVVLTLYLITGPVLGDWDSGGAHTIHFPQRPDPDGWGVQATTVMLADDWRCSQGGLVDDVHIWFSWQGDLEGTVDSVGLAIYADDANGPHSKPGEILWLHGGIDEADYFAIREYGTGDQRWYGPDTGTVNQHDHQTVWQLNITNIDEFCGTYGNPWGYDGAFRQEEGRVYWLSVGMLVMGMASYGWETADVGDYAAPWTGTHFGGAAVYWGTDPNTGKSDWLELADPLSGDLLDLAFVIAPEPTTLAIVAVGGLALLHGRRIRFERLP